MSLSLEPQNNISDFAGSRSQPSSGNYLVDRFLNASNPQGERVHTWFQSGLPTPPSTKDMTGSSIGHGYGNYSMTNNPYSISHNNGYAPSSHSRVPSDLYPSSVQAMRTSNGAESSQDNYNKQDVIASYLQIPESVNKSKGSLAEFAAEITCLFWFEDAETLQYAEDLPIDVLPSQGLGYDATPTIGFRKWVTTILSTTQVGKNVILLALMFIYRLKKFNPSVSGKRGSEFRLLTIALMLGNKFLDDNTYTNKTWAEVSGISVTEIHIMEVEFLSNMRYELHASEAEWSRWKALLGKFGLYYEKASKFQASVEAPINPPITPTSQTFNTKLPSPPSRHRGSLDMKYNTLPNPQANLPYLPYSPIRLVPNGALTGRKRSLENTDILPLPPAKRPQYLPPSSDYSSPASMHSLSTPLTHPGSGSTQSSSAQFNGHRIPHLPIPRIATSNSGVTVHPSPMSLPPHRAMAGVYQSNTSIWNQPLTPTSAVLANGTGHYSNPISVAGDETRTDHSTASSTHTSPVNFYGTTTPRPCLSPSYFLTNRSSPYRPVTKVNTLLFPPPSTATQSTVRNIDYQQMHYQPIGRPATERRSGPVPYLYPDGRQPSTTSTPSQLYRPF